MLITQILSRFMMKNTMPNFWYRTAFHIKTYLSKIPIGQSPLEFSSSYCLKEEPHGPICLKYSSTNGQSRLDLLHRIVWRISLCTPRAVQEIQSGLHHCFLLVHVDSIWLHGMGQESLSLELCNLSIVTSAIISNMNNDFFALLSSRRQYVLLSWKTFLFLLQTEKNLCTEFRATTQSSFYYFCLCTNFRAAP